MRPGLLWDFGGVARSVAAGLARVERALREEQAVRGLDALGEVALQAVAAEALACEGFGVEREVRYPGAAARPRRSEGWRCDLVLTPAARGGEGGAAADPGDRLWLEMKRVAQFAPERQTSGYAAALQGAVWRDLAKLAADPDVRHAAQVVVVFTAAEEAARHDLEVSLERAWSRGLRFDLAACEALPLVDRTGNAWCTTAVVRIVP